MEDINLAERSIEWMNRKQYRSAGRGTFWPSEARVQFTNQFHEEEILGKCKRATFYRLKGLKPTNPPTGKSQILFLLGHTVEAQVVEIWKQMGIWENNSVRFENREKNLSGEFDVVLREGDRKYGVEVKSFYGYYANKQILGHWSGRGANKRFVNGRPKDEHLMQAALYADHTRGTLEGFKLFYASRDNNEFKEFNITVNEGGTIFINGAADNRFTINDVYRSYAELGEHIANDDLPGKDFVFEPSDERVKVLFERGDVSKSAFDAHSSGKKRVSDFHCSYCNFKDHCLGPRSDSWDNPEAAAVNLDNPLAHGGL